MLEKLCDDALLKYIAHVILFSVYFSYNRCTNATIAAHILRLKKCLCFMHKVTSRRV
jgi:hypothetical protein